MFGDWDRLNDLSQSIDIEGFNLDDFSVGNILEDTLDEDGTLGGLDIEGILEDATGGADLSTQEGMVALVE